MRLSAVKTKPNLWDLLVALAVAAAAAVLFASLWGGAAGEALYAVVAIDGQETERVELRAQPEETRVYTANGVTLTVTFCPGGTAGVQVSSSDCPTLDCVRTGCITRAGQSIVCLPARLSISLVGGTDGLDAVVG